MHPEPDPYVALARLSVEHLVRHHRPLPEIPAWIRQALEGIQAGVFVSLHERATHELRGCIGTLAPTRDSVAEEVLHNAIAASSRDSRFSPVRAEELPGLDIRVDVLGEPEPVKDIGLLDPRRYGVIVSTGDGRRGLLLPDLEGVDSVELQLSIAARKGGIHLDREPHRLQRFTVVRHTEDGGV